MTKADILSKNPSKEDCLLGTVTRLISRSDPWHKRLIDVTAYPRVDNFLFHLKKQALFTVQSFEYKLSFKCRRDNVHKYFTKAITKE